MFTGFDDPLSLGITVFRGFFWGGGGGGLSYWGFGWKL